VQFRVTREEQLLGHAGNVRKCNCKLGTGVEEESKTQLKVLAGEQLCETG
jgi:hypothetical protein